MGEEMNNLDFFPRLEKWLAARGIPAEEILQCTQFIHTGDSTYLVTVEGKEKRSGHDSTVT